MKGRLQRSPPVGLHEFRRSFGNGGLSSEQPGVSQRKIWPHLRCDGVVATPRPPPKLPSGHLGGHPRLPRERPLRVDEIRPCVLCRGGCEHCRAARRHRASRKRGSQPPAMAPLSHTCRAERAPTSDERRPTAKPPAHPPRLGLSTSTMRVSRQPLARIELLGVKATSLKTTVVHARHFKAQLHQFN